MLLSTVDKFGVLKRLQHTTKEEYLKRYKSQKDCNVRFSVLERKIDTLIYLNELAQYKTLITKFSCVTNCY